jgi:hypothetical protein
MRKFVSITNHAVKSVHMAGFIAARCIHAYHFHPGSSVVKKLSSVVPAWTSLFRRKRVWHRQLF